MNKLSFQRNFAFFSILLIGLIYSLFLVIAFQKIHSGFVMQFIFIIDLLKNHPNDFLNFVISGSFLFNLFAGSLLIVLIIRFIKSIFQSVTLLIQTKKFLTHLTFKTKKQYYLTDLNHPIAFTAGFLKPHIYISTSLVDSVSKTELKAILLHEQKHQQNTDPLKDFIANFINHILPGFPKKDWLFGTYATLVEATCDEYSEHVLKTKLPLISALIKIKDRQKIYSYCFNQFSSQSERIKILINQKSPAYNNLFTFYSLMTFLLLFGSMYLYNSNVFYQCDHLIQCLEVIFVPKDTTPINHPSSPITLSDHCQSN